jgi:uncharacterized protein (TIGR00266 family)
MNIEVLARPSNAAAKLHLEPNETVTAEGGAMIAMSGDMNVETHVNKPQGGKTLFKNLGRLLGGEGLFLNYYTAGSNGGDLYLSTTLPGDMDVIELDGSRTVYVQNGSFVAHEDGVNLDISWGGMKNVFSGENLIWLKLSGTGKAVINAFGAIYPIDVDGEYIVDTGNIAAYQDTLDFSISKAGKSWVSSFVGGEGFVARFTGSGRVWAQTHADRAFGAKLAPLLTPKKN